MLLARSNKIDRVTKRAHGPVPALRTYGVLQKEEFGTRKSENYG